ncbi:hypothetical protein BD31_I1672 [Candidatus Nitrosopumilus salaria BD31]|uniref:Uncharacterized protein n=1 Tax=Candidatus Nitrosopumilus salarius BD31 TaxID=859350 RepID=I3D3J8_9ARCH|nr:hypothetical protein BD31_I1672 [Candidatus Nitrosopumilus salaria BD31]
MIKNYQYIKLHKIKTFLFSSKKNDFKKIKKEKLNVFHCDRKCCCKI